ncbi:uncharacterized protein F4812DRAFT_284822 [Daldinia caldariorum]|uniref:uncharacterized protein n=1 Tax=Daldinia caldariorum TaxID=326644 RepID=UPI002007B41C|nr:uncharacterized protein F4812DRAFT_284822 [Daldinia caldariorum]KAI1463117.1 hypothetical protein F4812DRAFT_284822 [Daldinia caldariorum]
MAFSQHHASPEYGFNDYPSGRYDQYAQYSYDYTNDTYHNDNQGVQYSQPSKDANGNGVQVHSEPVDDDAAPQNIVDINLQDPILAVVFFIGGLSAAVGHHVYYQRLHGSLVTSENQQFWAIRIGAGLALITKCGLVAAVGIAAVQQTWLSLRKRSISINGIDSMFGVMRNLWSFFSTDFLVNAKRLYLLAAVAWLLPIITVITPATLSVKSHVVEDIVDTKVPTYNFSSNDGWGVYGGWGYISGVAPEIARLFTRTYISNSFVPESPPFPDASYNQSFWGPSYKCSKPSEIIKTRNNRTWDYAEYNYTTFEQAFNAEIVAPITERNHSTGPIPLIYKSTAPTDMNNMILIGANGINERWSDDIHNYVVCQLYNTSYSVTMRFDKGIQSIQENSVKYISSQEWNNVRGKSSTALGKGACAPDPEANNATICPTYYMYHYVFQKFLAGTILSNAGGELIFQSDGPTVINAEASQAPFFQSGLTDCPEIWNSSSYQTASGGPLAFQTADKCTGGTLASAIEHLSRNFTYSLLTYSNWRNFTTEVSITVPTAKNFYYYNSRILLLAYSVAVVFTLLCVCVGLVALMKNGYTSSTAFSTVLLTTRNPDLDRLSMGNTLGAQPLPNRISATRLQFGTLRTEGSEPHAGFGMEGTVAPLENVAPKSGMLRKRVTERVVT